VVNNILKIEPDERGYFLFNQNNSRGFRDAEWPEKLDNVIWCIGDSFTVGDSQPYEETWPKILEKKISKRCLNLGEDGCSNDTITLRAQEIYNKYKPNLMIIMWSYFSRRRQNNINVHFSEKSFSILKDVQNFSQNFKIIDKLPITCIHLLIPNAVIDFNKIGKKLFMKTMLKLTDLTKEQIAKIIIFPQLDYAKDRHHFSIKTSELVTNLITKKITDIDNESK